MTNPYREPAERDDYSEQPAAPRSWLDRIFDMGDVEARLRKLEAKQDEREALYASLFVRRDHEERVVAYVFVVLLILASWAWLRARLA